MGVFVNPDMSRPKEDKGIRSLCCLYVLRIHWTGSFLITGLEHIDAVLKVLLTYFYQHVLICCVPMKLLFSLSKNSQRCIQGSLSYQSLSRISDW